MTARRREGGRWWMKGERARCAGSRVESDGKRRERQKTPSAAPASAIGLVEIRRPAVSAPSPPLSSLYYWPPLSLLLQSPLLYGHHAPRTRRIANTSPTPPTSRLRGSPHFLPAASNQVRTSPSARCSAPLSPPPSSPLQAVPHSPDLVINLRVASRLLIRTSAWRIRNLVEEIRTHIWYVCTRYRRSLIC